MDNSEDRQHLKDLAHMALIRIKKLEAEKAGWERATEPLALIGMACRTPGAADLEEFWDSQSGRRAVSNRVPADRWTQEDIDALTEDTYERSCLSHGYFLDDIDSFDPSFFGLSRREAESVDPQQRLLLETAWRAIEDAMIPVSSLRESKVGCFVGIAGVDQMLLAAGEKATADPLLTTGTAHSVAAGRLAYSWGLKGPAIAVDTACSSSMTALHLAGLSLRSGDCDVAIVGGVNVMMTPYISLQFACAKMLSPVGRCNSFDISADGFARGEGCGVLVLKRLSDAQSSGARIYATVVGSAVNQDGRTSGMTVPHGPSQQQVIREALTAAKLTPQEVGYLEAHGTGTALGDPIELNAIAGVFGTRESALPRIKVGSAKNNIGHLEAAAGIVGVIRAALSVYHGHFPCNSHFSQPTKAFAWDEYAIDIPSSAESWPEQEAPRVAGVSSFGFSGTNGHVILAQYDHTLPKSSNSTGEYQFHLYLSAKSKNDLQRLAGSWTTYLADLSPQEIQVSCAHAALGRDTFKHRLCVHADNRGELMEKLSLVVDQEGSVGNLAKRPLHLNIILRGGSTPSKGPLEHLIAGIPAVEWANERVQQHLNIQHPNDDANSDGFLDTLRQTEVRSSIFLLVLTRMGLPIKSIYCEDLPNRTAAAQGLDLSWLGSEMRAAHSSGCAPVWSDLTAMPSDNPAEAKGDNANTFMLEIDKASLAVRLCTAGHQVLMDSALEPLNTGYLHELLGVLFHAGATISWEALFSKKIGFPCKPLPGYPLSNTILPRRFRHQTGSVTSPSDTVEAGPIRDPDTLAATLYQVVKQSIPTSRAPQEQTTDQGSTQCLICDLDDRAASWEVPTSLQEMGVARRRLQAGQADLNLDEAEAHMIILRMSLTTGTVMDAIVRLIGVIGILLDAHSICIKRLSLLVESDQSSSNHAHWGGSIFDGVVRTLSAEFPEIAFTSICFRSGDEEAAAHALKTFIFDDVSGSGLSVDKRAFFSPVLQRCEIDEVQGSKTLNSRHVAIFGNRSGLAGHLAEEMLEQGAACTILDPNSVPLSHDISRIDPEIAIIIAPELDRGLFLSQDPANMLQRIEEISAKFEAIMAQLRAGPLKKTILLRGCESAFGWTGRIGNALSGDILLHMALGSGVETLVLDIPMIARIDRDDTEAVSRLAVYGIRSAVPEATAGLVVRIVELAGHYICLTLADEAAGAGSGEDMKALSQFSYRDLMPEQGRVIELDSLDDVRSQLMGILNETLGENIAEEDFTTPLMELGMDSLMALNIRTELLAKLSYQLSVQSTLNGMTFEDLAEDVWTHFRPTGTD